MKIMKKIFVISFLLFSISIFSELKAQGSNLEFNRVFLFTIDDGTLTVPNNKIWKVNSGGRNNLTNLTCSNNPYYETFSRLVIDNRSTWIHNGDFPFFIPEGVEVYLTSICPEIFSITEYNIVP